MGTPWQTSGGAPIVDGTGAIIECADCPCGIITDCTDYDAFDDDLNLVTWTMTADDGFSDQTPGCLCGDYDVAVTVPYSSGGSTTTWFGPADSAGAGCFHAANSNGLITMKCDLGYIVITAEYSSPSASSGGFFRIGYSGTLYIPLPTTTAVLLGPHAITATAINNASHPCMTAAATTTINIS